MSLKDRLNKKTEAILAPRPREVAPTLVQSAPKTGPGQMLAFRSHMLDSEQRVKDLEAQLSHYEGAIETRKIDSKIVIPSRWANRHDTSFTTPEFESLKLEISNAGGNVQPILVRPVGSKYEIVFGHRRHRACLDLELPVFAMVEQLDDKHLFALMDRENREREDLTPFEQGEMWRRALDEKLYPSARQMAGELGLSNGLVSRAVAIANLPQEVLQAFASPTQIQYRWGDALTSALNDSPSVVLKRAREIAKLKEPLDAKTVFARLIASDATAAKDELNIVLKGEVVGRMTYGKDGSVNFKLNKSVIGKSSLKGLHAAVTNFLKQTA